MAFHINNKVEQEIRAMFCREEQNAPKRLSEFRQLFKKHGNLTMKHLKRKFHIIYLEAYIEVKMFPRVLWEWVIPAGHLHND